MRLGSLLGKIRFSYTFLLSLPPLGGHYLLGRGSTHIAAISCSFLSTCLSRSPRLSFSSCPKSISQMLRSALSPPWSALGAPQSALHLLFPARLAKRTKGSRSLFKCLRKAAAGFAQGSLVLILMDTHARLANFAPAVHQDPAVAATQLTIFAPFYAWDAFDLGQREQLEQLARAPAVKWRDLLRERQADPSQFLSLGRPLWGSHLSGGPLELLGIVCIRIPFAVVPASIEAHNLVASNMACVAFVLCDPLLLYTGYPSEPVMAAASLWEQHIFDVLSNLFCLAEQMQVGHRGEFLAQVILLPAFDSLSNMASGSAAARTPSHVQ